MLRITYPRSVAARLVLTTLALLWAAIVDAGPKRDYIATAATPDRLFVIDAAARSIRSEFRIPAANDFLGAIVPSPDGRVAYILVNKMESISGIDLDSGKEIFRANLSSPGERVKCLFAFDVTPDGKELIVYELPVR